MVAVVALECDGHVSYDWRQGKSKVRRSGFPTEISDNFFLCLFWCNFLETMLHFRLDDASC